MSFENRAEDLRLLNKRLPGAFVVSAPVLWEELANINEGIAEILAAQAKKEQDK